MFCGYMTVKPISWEEQRFFILQYCKEKSDINLIFDAAGVQGWTWEQSMRIFTNEKLRRHGICPLCDPKAFSPAGRQYAFRREHQTDAVQFFGVGKERGKAGKRCPSIVDQTSFKEKWGVPTGPDAKLRRRKNRILPRCLFNLWDKPGNPSLPWVRPDVLACVIGAVFRGCFTNSTLSSILSTCGSVSFKAKVELRSAGNCSCVVWHNAPTLALLRVRLLRVTSSVPAWRAVLAACRRSRRRTIVWIWITVKSSWKEFIRFGITYRSRTCGCTLFLVIMGWENSDKIELMIRYLLTEYVPMKRIKISYCRCEELADAQLRLEREWNGWSAEHQSKEVKRRMYLPYSDR